MGEERNRLAELPDLGEGDTHDGVGDLQAFLVRFGYLPAGAEVDRNRIDGATVAALKSYQRFFGLSPTGRVDADTREHMAMGRCGMKDHTALRAGVGSWTRRNLTFGLGKITTDPVGVADAEDAVRRAFDTWQNAGVGLAFTEVSANPDIHVEWRGAGDPDGGLGGSGALAHADFPPGFSQYGSPLPLHLNENETWVDGAARGYDIESVALHEIGHCLGLNHTGVAGSVMWPNISQQVTARQLGADDLAALKALYPPWGSLHAAVSWGPNRYDVFGLNNAGEVLLLTYDGTWNKPRNLGNGFANDRFVGHLTAASWGPGRLDVFGLGQNHNVLQLTYDGRWRWHDLGNKFTNAQFAYSPTATSRGPNRYDLFGFSKNFSVLYLWFDGHGWHWDNLGYHWTGKAEILPQLTAVSFDHNRNDVFGVNLDGQVLQLYGDGSTWKWVRHGNDLPEGQIAGFISAASWGRNRIDIFGVSSTGDVIQFFFDGNWHWTTLRNGFPGDRFAALLAAASWGPNRIDVFGIGESGSVLQLWYNGRFWNWNKIGTMT